MRTLSLRSVSPLRSSHLAFVFRSSSQPSSHLLTFLLEAAYSTNLAELSRVWLDHGETLALREASSCLVDQRFSMTSADFAP